MNNLLPRAIHMSEKYDLKGSTYKRKASKHELAKSSPTFKDLDFKEKNSDGILLEADTHEALVKTLRRDCRVCMLKSLIRCLDSGSKVHQYIGLFLYSFPIQKKPMYWSRSKADEKM